MTNWKDPHSRVTPHFTVEEACWLPSWGKLHDPTPTEQANLTRLCELMEKVRAFVKAPVQVHCMIRPAAYNKLVGGAKGSAHILGLACDFDVPGTDCDDLRKFLLPKLEEWDCRCEDLPGAGWVHLDLAPVKSKRFFKP